MNRHWWTWIGYAAIFLIIGAGHIVWFIAAHEPEIGLRFGAAVIGLGIVVTARPYFRTGLREAVDRQLPTGLLDAVSPPPPGQPLSGVSSIQLLRQQKEEHKIVRPGIVHDVVAEKSHRRRSYLVGNIDARLRRLASEMDGIRRKMTRALVVSASKAPALVAAVGERASYRFFEFFTANIRNPHTRRAYARAAVEFFDWLEARGVTRIAAVESVHVAAYIEQLQKARSAPTAKLRLAALRHLFDWLVIGQIMPTNPAAAVRGPRHIVRRGKTPVLDPQEARQLIGSGKKMGVIGVV